MPLAQHDPETPRPRIDDIPLDPTNRDILFEVRSLQWEYRRWRDERNGDFAFLRKLRTAVNTIIRCVVRLIVVGVPVCVLAVAIFVALRP